jgi:hypothetical protein
MPTPTKKGATKKPAKKSAKKGAKKGAAKGGSKRGMSAGAEQLTSAGVGRLGQRVNIDQLSQTVGTAVTRALAGQGAGGILNGTIICGIIYDLKSKRFKPLIKMQ